ncbi:MAG: fibronectin type III domain-containing protein, partial [Candidatus Magasanikbacteria bacterium]|nr:fibronectin type III domain-containing protein [Candidatus Magasanikbacteria bacterium]
MKLRTLRSMICSALCFSMMLLNIAPALALGEGLTPPPPTPPPVESAPTPPPVETPPTTPIVTLVTPPADTTAPTIAGAATASLGLNDVTIVWTTNELAISTLNYGTTESLGSSATLPVSALLAHTATLTGLTPNTTYYYCIHATDLAGNVANSCGHSFATAAPLDTTAPTITSITDVAVTSTIVSVAWTTSEL